MSCATAEIRREDAEDAEIAGQRFNEEMRIALAKADGYVFSGPDRAHCDASMDMQRVPDYLRDLDAMHALVMKQPEGFRKAMRFFLYEICGQMRAHDATARERARAFLMTRKALGVATAAVEDEDEDVVRGRGRGAPAAGGAPC